MDSDARLDAEREIDRVVQAVQQLDPDDRDLLVLVVWEGCTSAEAAEALDTPAGTVRSRLNRIRRQLREQAADVGWQEIPLEPTRDGFDAATWTTGTERLLRAELVDADGHVLADTGPLNSLLAGSGDIVAEGHTGVAWIVHRQDRNASTEPGNMVYLGDNPDGTDIPYCLLLSGPSEFAPLCPPATPPDSGIGAHAEYNDTLGLVEIGPDVATVRCEGTEMPIFTDSVLDNRRFAVVSCDDPATT